ncbi:MAG: hypothetical protein WBB01_05775 [Phormidesmis sp.]
MIRVIILLLILAALVILAVQNFSTSVALVILSGKTAAIPFGLLLAGAVGMGALISLILYGLVGLRRSPESKYRPLGRRVPYPESPGDTSLPSSSPPYQPPSTYGSSSAFVSAPVTPQDAVGSPPATEYPGVPQDATYRPSQPPPPPPEKKKSPPQSESDRDSSGGDWGELRTAAQRDSWDTEGGNAAADSSQKRGLFDFIRPGSGGGNPDRLTDDIATGWDEAPAQSEYSSDDHSRYDPGYDDGLDRGWERFDSYDEAPPPVTENPAYERRVYQDGLYGADEFFEEPAYADENRPGEIGPDGVYEADYRVIIPPSQPLDDDLDDEDDEGEKYSS